MTEGGTREEFGHWVEPHLTVLARYAARQVGAAERDQVLEEALVRAWQRRARYDESRGTVEAWLLGILGEVCRRPRPRSAPAAVVELVDETVTRPPDPDLHLEQMLEDLDPQERLMVDLHYFVGLDVATVAEVRHCERGQVMTPLLAARATLGRLTGDDDEHTDQRLRAAARRWQGEQAPAPDVRLERLHDPVRRPLPWRRAAAVAMGAVLVGVVSVVVVRAQSSDEAAPRGGADRSPTPQRVRVTGEVVPWRDLQPGHRVRGHDENGVRVTPYDEVTVTGSAARSVRAGDTFVFYAALTAPGLVTLHPCPDYTIAFGTRTITRQLNCEQVPYFASIVRPDGDISAFRPVLPSGTAVFFRMQVTAPDEPGSQEVRWTLEGPTQTPSFSATVQVTAPGAG
jgi:DNA-directed RNA polymerase specialized sigma24 family protein